MQKIIPNPNKLKIEKAIKPILLILVFESYSISEPRITTPSYSQVTGTNRYTPDLLYLASRTIFPSAANFNLSLPTVSLHRRQRQTKWRQILLKFQYFYHPTVIPNISINSVHKTESSVRRNPSNNLKLLEPSHNTNRRNESKTREANNLKLETLISLESIKDWIVGIL